MDNTLDRTGGTFILIVQINMHVCVSNPCRQNNKNGDNDLDKIQAKYMGEFGKKKHEIIQ